MALDLSKSDPKSIAWTYFFDVLIKYGEKVLNMVRRENCFQCEDAPNQSAQYLCKLNFTTNHINESLYSSSALLSTRIQMFYL